MIENYKIILKVKLVLILVFFIGINYSFSQNCNISQSKNRRSQVITPINPYSFIVQMKMKRGRSYYGTAFFIAPRVLLTAGHNLRKRKQIYFTRVKALTLRFGATSDTNVLDSLYIKTAQNENIYTLDSFNGTYSIYEDYGIIILPDETAYRKVGGVFKLNIFDSSILHNTYINLAGYPSDKPYSTLWLDSTKNFSFNNGCLHYDFATAHGASGSPIWYLKNNYYNVFAIHTNGNKRNNQNSCNTGTIITQKIYDDIVRFCLTKGIDITK